MQESERCILCTASSFRVIHRKDEWKYLLCQNCGLVCLHPKPTTQTLTKNYEDYLSVQPKEISNWELMIRPVVTRSADLIESRSRTARGKLLDIGCGYGFFLQEMKSRGWQVNGIEISQTGRQYAKSRWGIEVFSEPLENLQFPENSFDVVTLFYVIEHLLEPLSLMKAVNRILKPNGLVLLRWPHSTPIVKLLGSLSRKLDLYHTPYHIYDFSPKTIERLLNQTGFSRVKTLIAGHTLPSSRPSRWSSIAFGHLGALLCSLSSGSILLPGVSKMTLAFK
jgi:2-polyprenyl-3-methyl-5-hydroxy-6-metoxy-1,4-benzoquinol methylase